MHLHARSLDDLAPLVDFLSDELVENLRRAARRGDAVRLEPILDVARLDELVHFGVEAVDDGAWQAFGSDHAVPVGHLGAWQARFADGWNVRRCADATCRRDRDR